MPEGKSYRILDKVASGGTAVLYRAMQLSLDRVVAVKRLHQHLTQDENFTRRFVLEAKAAASLDHQNIVRVIDFGIEEGSYQMVMEFVEGESLKDVLDRWRPLPDDLSLAIVHQICRGLEHAHAKGIVHRDIKPGNIMLTRAGVAKITDFGLAKLTQSNTVQTASDSILGTPLYMSPEQAFGESVDQRSDLFSLGTVLYELLTGRQPFVSENYMGVIQNIIHKEIPSVRELVPAVSPEIEAIVMRALAKDRDARFAGAREFREAIEHTLGLDALMRATAALPVLLERDQPTRALTRSEVMPAPVSPNAKAMSSTWSTVSSAKKRQRSGPSVWLVAPMIAVVLIGAATWFFWPRLRGAYGDGAPAPVQQASLGDVPGFDPTPSVASADSARVDSSHTTIAMGDATPVAPDTVAVEPPAPAPRTEKADSSAAKVEVTQASEPPAAAADEPVEAPAPKPTKPKGEPDKPFREGYLMLNVEPTAEIYINGIYRGTAAPTLRLTMPVGMFSVECRAENHETYLESIRVIAGELSQRTIVLQKHLGIISLATTEGAELYVDGQLMGITPITRPIEVPAGVHTLTLKKDRFFTWTSDVTVEANATLPLRITLSPRY